MDPLFDLRGTWEAERETQKIEKLGASVLLQVGTEVGG